MKRRRRTASLAKRRRVMRAFVGIWKNRKNIADSTAYIRQLRKGTRLERLASLREA